MTNSDPFVRPGRDEDLEAILSIDHILERADEVRRAVAEGRALVADSGSGVTGFCVRGRFFDYDFLQLLVVDEASRRRGVATALVRAWEETAGTTKLFISTNESNLPMRALLTMQGYRPSGSVENLDEGDPELFFFKPGRPREQAITYNDTQPLDSTS